MSQDQTLTATGILAAASSDLNTGGYRRVDDSLLREWPFSNSHVFEDRFGIVAVLVFESWEELTAQWPDAQSSFSSLITEFIGRSEPKAWDGYLVLLTPGIRGTKGQSDWMHIRYNTSRFRKLVASGEDLRSSRDVRAALLPLLPLDAAEVDLPESESVLDLVPDLVEHRNLSQDDLKSVVAAFREESNMLQAIHDSRTAQE